MLSIIVPIHNGAQYLRKCISSILSSSYQDFEIILVENASTDNSLDLCRQLGRKNSCIKIISTEVGGVSHARNLGLDAADGEYITFVDCDDYISPYMYETLMRGIVDTGADIIFCDIKMGNDTGFDFHQPNYSVKSMSKDSFFYNTYMKSQYKCESRGNFPKRNGKHSECNTTKDMQEQALRRAHFGSGLNICQGVKPVKERFDGLPHRAYKCRHGVPSEKCVAALLLAGYPNLHSILLF